jgi:hypothetical protein
LLIQIIHQIEIIVDPLVTIKLLLIFFPDGHGTISQLHISHIKARLNACFANLI